ncbi:helix-turn-helix domain-containing protein, partial [Lysobacter sp. 2RAB21]
TEMYRYVGCGLPNVFLRNGYEMVKTPYGEGVTIHDLDGLHQALGSTIVGSPDPLSGAEFRFIRTELELSQKMLGQLLGCNEQAVARWEKGRSKVDAPAERLLRLF